MMLAPLHNLNESTEWVVLYVAGALPPEEKIAFEKHLQSGCAKCLSQLQAFEGVADWLAAEVSAAPPVALRERLLARVRDEVAFASIHTTTPGVLFQMGGLLISRAADIPWESAPIPGIASKILYIDPARKYSTSLVRMEPNSVYPSHRHNDIEEVYLIEGDLTVEGVRMRPGDYCRSEPGTIHGDSRTELGNLLLVFASQCDELLT